MLGTIDQMPTDRLEELDKAMGNRTVQADRRANQIPVYWQLTARFGTLHIKAYRGRRGD